MTEESRNKITTNMELSRQSFQNNELRIFGTPEEPLFVANDVAKILDIKNANDKINKFKDYKKDNISYLNSAGVLQTITVLTEAGLYSLIHKARSSIGREFEKWLIAEALPALHENNYRSNRSIIERQRLEELESQLEESHAEIEYLKQGYKPEVIYHKIDINKFTNHPCVYLIHITDNDYKFGVSSEVDVRLDTHTRSFTKAGANPKLVKIWKCESVQIMKDTEMKIKVLAKQNHIIREKYNKREILETDNIGYIVDCIDDYITDQNSRDAKYMEIKKLEMELESKRLDSETKKLELESKKLDVEAKKQELESKRLDTEFIKLQIESQKLKQRPVDCKKQNDPIVDNVAENDVIIGALTPSQGLLRTVALDWVAADLPQDRENTKDYYKKYTTGRHEILNLGWFNRQVTSFGYTIERHNKNITYWRTPSVLITTN